MVSSKGSSKKLSLVFLSIVVFALFLALSLFRWQVIDSDDYKSLATTRAVNRKENGLRGKIKSSDGTVLAYSKRVYDLYLSKKEVEEAVQRKVDDYFRQDKYALFDALTKELGYESDFIEEKYNASPITYFKLEENLSEEQRQKLINLEIGDPPKKPIGIFFEDDEERIYPNKEIASHILGFVGKDNLGKNTGRNGTEEYWNGDLMPKEGIIEEEIDNQGNRILSSDSDKVYFRDGRDVELTIDLNVQTALEKKLAEGVANYNAKSGSAVIMNPKTGEIIAIANYPSYDPNKYFEVADVNDLTNKAISTVYENGSVWKAFTASAAINEELFEPDTIVFNSHKACMVVLEDKSICTAFRNSVNKPTDLRGVIQTSDNIGTYLIAKKLGSENLYNYLKLFGIGNYTNLGLANEQTDVLQEPTKWNELDLAVISFGQAEAGTLLQTVSGFSAIANYGTRMQPYIVKRVTDSKEIINFEPKVLDTVITKETAEKMSDVLVTTFEAQGASKVSPEMKEYRIAGKTGTAQVPKKDGTPGYEEEITNVTMIGFDAGIEKSFVMGIKLEEPETKTFAFQSALPLWIDAFKDIKDYLGVDKVK